MDHYQALCRFCAYQDRSRKEIEEKLKELSVSEALWGETLEKLKEERFWDEARFARSYARGKFRIKRWGRIRIRQELKMRGVSDILILEGLKEIEEADYLIVARKLAAKKLLELKRDKPAAARQKAFRYLLQKGFESEIVRQILSGECSDTE